MGFTSFNPSYELSQKFHRCKDVDGRNKSGHDERKPPVLTFADKTAVL